MQELIGKVVGSYTITAFIGEGGMGTVWEGKHNSIDRKVAIKVLHPQYARNEKVRERFRREATTLSKLQHPNIVALYDYVETETDLFLVMEYVDGTDLDELVKKHTGPLPNDRLGPLFKQILSAIGYAHKMNVIHRDIKPANFMVTQDGTVKVLDFGIAKLLEDDQHLTKTGMRMGTTFYMSPEQVNGQGIDQRSDIYSLGVMLFVLATGQAPFEATSTEFQIFNKIVNEPLPKPTSVYPGVTPSVEALIYKATAKNPANRFQTCEEFMVGTGITPPATATQPVPPPVAPVSQSNPAPQQPYVPPVTTHAAPASYTGIRVFAIFTLVFMGILAIAFFGGGGYLISLRNDGGYMNYFYYHSWDSDELIAFNLGIGTAFSCGFIFLMMAISGIGILARGTWARIIGIVDLFIILLLALLVGLIGFALAVAADVPYEARPYSVYFFLATFALLGYTIWGLVVLFSGKTGRYIRRV